MGTHRTALQTLPKNHSRLFLTSEGCFIFFRIPVRAEIITELILERVGPVIFKMFLLELITFRLLPVICPARRGKPENYWK